MHLKFSFGYLEPEMGPNGPFFLAFLPLPTLRRPELPTPPAAELSGVALLQYTEKLVTMPSLKPYLEQR